MTDQRDDARFRRTVQRLTIKTRNMRFSMGADDLARLELRLMLSDLLSRIDQIELAGKVERLKSNLIAGIKHMPVRFTQARVAA